MKKIVCFGGGNAMPNVLLSEIKNYSFKIVSVSSMADSGGSSGRLSKQYGVLPVGDIRRHLLAFSEQDKATRDLFNFRFKNGELAGHNLGNIFILASYLKENDFLKAIRQTANFLKTKKNCECLPAILENTNLFAKLENGKIIKGEDEIDNPKKHNPALKIKSIFIQPGVKTYQRVLKNVMNCDLIILGPGDLYSSILPCFLSNGIKESIKKTKAKILFFCPAMTKLGETNKFSVLDFTKEVEKYLERKIDFILYNNKIVSNQRLKVYRNKNKQFLKQVGIDKNLNKLKFIGGNLLFGDGVVEYNPKKVMKQILNII